MRPWLLCAIATLGCGRVYYEQRGCPSDMVEVDPDGGSSFCIERDDRTPETWVSARQTCESLGRRLCTDQEWLGACTGPTGSMLIDMIDDYEWTATLVAPDEAQKYGAGACDSGATHSTNTDPYQFRCCTGR